MEIGTGRLRTLVARGNVELGLHRFRIDALRIHGANHLRGDVRFAWTRLVRFWSRGSTHRSDSEDYWGTGSTFRVAILPPFMRIDFPQRGTAAIVDCAHRRVTTFYPEFGAVRSDVEQSTAAKPSVPYQTTSGFLIDVKRESADVAIGADLVDTFVAVSGNIAAGGDPRTASIATIVRGPSRFTEVLNETV